MSLHTPQRKLKTKLLWIAVPFMLSLTLATSLIISHRRTQAQLIETRQEQELTISIYADFASEPMWQFDRATLQNLAHRVSAMPGLVQINFLDANRQPIASARNGVVTPPQAAELYTLERVITHLGRDDKPKRIGVAQMQFRPVQPTSARWATFAEEFGLVMFTMLAMLGLSTALYMRLIKSPLDRLLLAIRQSLSSSQFLQVPHSTNDEMGEIIDTYNSLQAHLAGQSQQLFQLYNQTPGLLFTLSPDGHIASVSDYFCRELQYERSALLGRAFESILHTNDQTAGAPSWQGHTKGEVMRGLKLCVKRGDGTVLHALMNSFSPRSDKPEEAGAANCICVITDITKHVEDQEAITRQANYDPVTDLPNRYLLRDRLNMALHGARRENSMVAVIFMDLDRFKAINDTLGHKAGDDLLAEVGRRLRDIVRAVDTVGRIGGDEFVVVINNVCERQEIELVAQRIMQSLAAPIVLGGHHVQVSGSMGASLYPVDGRDADTLLMHADAAMYTAKQSGRNAFRFFQTVVNDDLARRQDLERRLRHAMAHNHFRLYLQPIVALDGNHILGFEALVRLISQDDGMVVMPDKFIPMAEDIGLIDELGRWVLEQVVLTLAQWPPSSGGPSYISVNVAGKQLNDASLPAHINTLLSQHNVPPDRLMLEVSEASMVEFSQQGPAALNALKACGCRLALDGFGTGGASIPMLQQWQLDTLKLDRNIVAGLTHDQSDIDLINSALAVAQTLKINVVALGIETAEQALAIANAAPQHRAQGFLFGKPIPADHWIANSRKSPAQSPIDSKF